MIDKIQQRPRPLIGLLKNKLFLATTAVPTVLAILYFGLIASDVYTSESRFVVRSPDRQAASPLGLVLKGAGFSKAQDDSYTVYDFVLSRDALKSLDEELHIKDKYSSPSINRFSRFAGIDWDDSFEALHLYYQNKVSVQLDSTSAINTLTTRAFSGEDAYAINNHLIKLSEELVNRLNERGRQDMIRFAAAEVSDAEKKAKAAAVSLARFRNDNEVIDPEKQSATPLLQISKLQEELLSTKLQIMQLEKIAKDNSQLPMLRQKAQLLKTEIQEETKLVAGGGARSLAGKAVEYHQLAMEKEVAEKMLASALATLEQAKSDAQRKQLYLERISGPNLPDQAMEPKRIKAILAVLVLGIIAWGVFAMVVAGVREHMN